MHRSHYFEGRYENLYVDADALPALDPVRVSVRWQAAQALRRSGDSLKLGHGFNKTLPGQRTRAHSHDDWDELLSGVLCIQASPDSGHLRLHTRPRHTFIPPQVGGLVLCPPSLEHEVEPNRSSELRLSLGLNVGPGSQTALKSDAGFGILRSMNPRHMHLAGRGTTTKLAVYWPSRRSNRSSDMEGSSNQRRGFLRWAAAVGGMLAAGRTAQAYHTDTHFEDKVAHKLVYQCNKADPDYLEHIMFSVGEMVRKYGDDIHLVVTAFGPGIHILGKKPGRPIPKEIQERVVSLAAYGVDFHACGNTMDSLKWTKDDLVEFAEVVQVGVDDLMQLQEKGFAYCSW